MWLLLVIYPSPPFIDVLPMAHTGNFIDLHTEEQFLNSRYSKKARAVIMR